MADYLIGIDYGTGGAKATIIDSQGNDLAYAFEEYPILHPNAGWAEHKPMLYWEIACRLIREIIAKSGAPSEEIRGVACSSALPSLVLVDRQHNPVVNAYCLLDRRATAQVDWLKENIGEDELYKVAPYPLEDHPSVINMMWERDNRPETFAKVWKALTIDGFINLRLTGKATVHYSGAAFYGVSYIIREARFDHGMMERVGLSPDLLPDLYACQDIIGEVTTKAAEEIGLKAGTPVAAGQVDCNAGWVGGGAVEEGDVQMNLGTCGNFGVIHKHTDFVHKMISFPYTTERCKMFISVPTTLTGGQCIRYMRDNFYPAEKALEGVLGHDTYSLTNIEAARVPPGSEGLVFLPFLMGERTPIWDNNARGMIFGLSLNHTRGHVIRAIMEAIAYALYHNYEILRDAGTKIKEPMILNEGGAKSALWRQIITDVFNVPTALVKRRVGAPYGDAILAGVATGIFPDFHIAREWAEYVDEMEPNAANHQRYMEYYRLYRRLYEHVKDDYVELARLRNL